MSDRSPRPLISAQDRSVGGEARETANFSLNPDLTFIPGYSDKRRQIDSELGRGLEPTVGLNHRFQWVVTQRVNGSPSRTKAMQFKGMRYERITQDKLLELGYGMPDAAELMPDGGLRLGDTELFYCSAAQAAENESLAHRAMESQTADDHTASALHSAGREIDRVGGLTTASTTHRVEVSPR